MLAEPIEDCLWRTPAGEPCLEARTPTELEAELGLPGGNIFHRDLAWPFAEDEAEVGAWGVETAHEQRAHLRGGRAPRRRRQRHPGAQRGDGRAPQNLTLTLASGSMAIESATVRRRFGVHAGHEHYKWWALSCTSLGMLLATINSGTLIIALPDLERALGTSILSLVWVILAYMISSTVLVLFAGRLSDLFGRKRAYVAGFAVFGLASLGAGFAGGGTELIVWRVLQGVGGAFLFANASALVTDAFPREQLGLAMGTNTMVAAVGLVIGPVLGGALVAISWHWVFWFNVPFTLVGSLWAGLILRELARPDRVRGYDLPGVLVFVAGLTGLVFGLSRGGLDGWGDPWTLAGIVAGAVLLPIFVVIESRQRAPMLDLTIFRDRLFAAATGAAFINGLSRFALMFLFVFYFQGVKGDAPDHRRDRARADGDRHADRVAAGGHLGRPPRLARCSRRRGWRSRRSRSPG